MAYQPLDEKRNEIRVLQFATSGSGQGPIHLTLEHVSLDRLTNKYQRHLRNSSDDKDEKWLDAFTRTVDHRMGRPNGPNKPQYRGHTKSNEGRFSWGDFEALSYAWGERDTSHKVILNGVPKAVSATLDSGLRQMRRLPETGSGMRFWIDALCINQEDRVEKNHQVKRMSKIYSMARAVIVWLGQASEDDERTIRIMNDTYRDAKQNNRLIPPANFTGDDWKALCAFMRKPYWGRLWIIQELAANHHSTLFLCGKRTLNREMISKGSDCCQKLLREDRRFAPSARSDVWLIATRMYRLVNLSIAQPPPNMLNTALGLARQAEASEPRDKVFGILGLLDKSISSKIVPDYDDSVQQVFTDLTVTIIRVTRSLEQIAYRAEQLAPGWPSWVPDLRSPFPRHNVKSLRNRQASENTSVRFKIKESERGNLLLCCKGYKVDIIDGIAASSKRSLITMADSTQIHRQDTIKALHRSLVLDHPKTRRHPALKKVPWMFHCSSNEAYTSISPPIWEEIFKSKQFDDFRKFREANEDFRIGSKDFPDFFSSSPTNITKPHVIMYHLRLAVHSLKGRRLATTDTGYIAMVPGSVQKGDVVAVLLGCNFPVLLRPHGDYFRVLGECYVHGLMDGQVFGLVRDAKVELEELQLY
ncbi:Nn.00g027610.m01.CDS01 [Neocucurbitaria sp. VM-36]